MHFAILAGFVAFGPTPLISEAGGSPERVFGVRRGAGRQEFAPASANLAENPKTEMFVERMSYADL